MNYNEYKLKDSKSVSEYKECFSAYIDVYGSLYDIFEKYSGVDMKSVAKQKILSVYNDYTKVYTKYKEIDKSSKELLVCSIYISGLKNILDDLIISNDISWSLNYSLIRICLDYNSMLNGLNTL